MRLNWSPKRVLATPGTALLQISQVALGCIATLSAASGTVLWGSMDVIVLNLSVDGLHVTKRAYCQDT